MTLVQIFLLVLLLLLVGGLLWLPFWGGRRRRGLTSLLTRYQRITASLLEGDLAAAREELKTIIRADTEDIGAYLHLVRILEREGNLDRAIAVRSSLLARQLRDQSLRHQILVGLIADLAKLQRYREAETQAAALEALERRDPWVARARLLAALERGDEKTALHQLDRLRRRDERAFRAEAPAVRAWLARQRLQGSDERGALRLLEEALRIDRGYLPATLMLADLHMDAGQHGSAAEVLTEALKRQPAAAPWLLARLEKAYFELGRFGELEEIYTDLLGSASEATAGVRLALARMALRKGETNRGLALVEELVQQDPYDPTARQWQLHLLDEAGRHSELRRALKRTAEEATVRRETVVCVDCGRPTEPTAVRCPDCGAWLPQPAAGDATEG